ARNVPQPVVLAIGGFHQVDQPRTNHGAVAPTAQDFRDVQLVLIAFEQVDAFTDGLEHPEFDPVVDQLCKVAGAGWARVYVAALHRKVEQDGLDSRDRLGVAACHETRAGPSTLYSPAGAEVDEADPPLGEAGVAPNRIAPVRVAGVDDDVARVQDRGQVVQDCIDHRAGGHVDED